LTVAFAPLRDRVSATATNLGRKWARSTDVRHPIAPNTQVTTDIGCDYGTRYRGRWTSARSDRSSHRTRPSSLPATTRIALVELVPCPAQRRDLLRPDVQLVWVEVRGVTGHHNVSGSSATSSPTHLLVEPGSHDAVSPAPHHPDQGPHGLFRRRPRVGRGAAAGRRPSGCRVAGWRLRAPFGCPPAVVSGLPRRSRVTRSRGLWISGIGDSRCKGPLQVPLRNLPRPTALPGNVTAVLA
jgi:hypothetical protein